jgi:pimeloyl-ACP methyl ester carboxylesterase
MIRASIALALLISVLGAGCGGSETEQGEPSRETSVASTTPGLLPETVIDDSFAVEPHGQHLALRCLGEGSPTVILEAGTDSSAIEQFTLVRQPLGRRTMTCAYDRLGTGASDPPSKMRRTLDDVVADLHGLIEAAGLAGPFVLVGTSGGGNIAFHYAGSHPDQVAGVVMLDVPSAVSDLEVDFGPRVWTKNPEHLDYTDAVRQLARHPLPLGDIPLRVVTATEGQSNAKDQSYWLEFTSNGEQTTVEGGHDLASANPSAVVAEIESFLDSIEG